MSTRIMVLCPKCIEWNREMVDIDYFKEHPVKCEHCGAMIYWKKKLVTEEK